MPTSRAPLRSQAQAEAAALISSRCPFSPNNRCASHRGRAPSTLCGPAIQPFLSISSSLGYLGRAVHPLPFMDPTADKELSANEIWPNLHQGRKQRVCHLLAQYRGPVASTYFNMLVKGAHGIQPVREDRAQLATAGKRKLSEDEAADAQSASKKPKVSEAPAPLQARGIDLASPMFPLGWPTFREAPIKFGQPTLMAATGDTTPTTWSSCPATSSISSGNTQNSNTGLFTFSTQGALASSSVEPNRGGLFSSPSSVSSRGVPNRGRGHVYQPTGGRGFSSSMGSFRGLSTSSATVLNQGGIPSSSSTVPSQGLFSSPFGSAKAKTPAQQEPECDEQFTFADRQSSQPLNPPWGSQYRTSGQIPASSDNSPQATNGAPPVSTVYKPPFSGVDMSSLKIPANSNVSVTLNVFQAPSSLHQVTDSGVPRKLKCIQCGVLYMEAQNTALECRRHTGKNPHSNPLLDFAMGDNEKLITIFHIPAGRCVGANDPKLHFQGRPFGAQQVWDCCRRTAQGQGCYPCNHYAG